MRASKQYTLLYYESFIKLCFHYPHFILLYSCRWINSISSVTHRQHTQQTSCTFRICQFGSNSVLVGVIFVCYFSCILTENAAIRTTMMVCPMALNTIVCCIARGWLWWRHGHNIHVYKQEKTSTHCLYMLFFDWMIRFAYKFLAKMNRKRQRNRPIHKTFFCVAI